MTSTTVPIVLENYPRGDVTTVRLSSFLGILEDHSDLRIRSVLSRHGLLLPPILIPLSSTDFTTLRLMNSLLIDFLPSSRSSGTSGGRVEEK